MDEQIDIIPPPGGAPYVPTIEDRLDAKTARADPRDHAGRRSLGQMSRDEQRKVLFGE